MCLLLGYGLHSLLRAVSLLSASYEDGKGLQLHTLSVHDQGALSNPRRRGHQPLHDSESLKIVLSFYLAQELLALETGPNRELWDFSHLQWLTANVTFGLVVYIVLGQISGL